MYYLLETDTRQTNVYMNQTSHRSLRPFLGRSIQLAEPEPIFFKMEVDEDEDEEIPETPILGAYYSGSRLMHRSLVNTLIENGVNNLQLLRASIEDPYNGKIINDYVLFNVIGIVSCANVAESDCDPLAGFYYFHNLVIDPDQTHGLNLFRLAEMPTEVIVHEKIAQAIEQGRFNGILLKPLDEKPSVYDER